MKFFQNLEKDATRKRGRDRDRVREIVSEREKEEIFKGAVK